MVLTVASQQHRRGVLNRARSGGFPEDTITFPAGSPVGTGRVEGCSCAIDDLRKREDRVMGRASARLPRFSSLHYRQWRREPFVDRDEHPGDAVDQTRMAVSSSGWPKRSAPRHRKQYTVCFLFYPKIGGLNQSSKSVCTVIRFPDA
jgi:hypothetical protein